jgi:hypothetical protein
MEDRLKRLFGLDEDREDPRRRAEMKIVWRLLDTVLGHGQEMLQAKRQERLTSEGSSGGAHGSTILPDLTDTERAIFNRPSYYGWTEASIAGGLTFCVLFGGLRLAALRSGRINAYIQPPSPSVRKNYSDLDLPTKSSSHSARRSGNKGDNSRRGPDSSTSQQRQQRRQQQQQESQPSEGKLSVGEDVMMQLQFMCTGAMALAVMSFTANLFADLPKFYRELSALPLQPGRSPLCHSMCPDLMQQMEQLRTVQKIQNNKIIDRQLTGEPNSLDSVDNDNVDSDNATTEQVLLSFETSELLQDPMTSELESMVRMVQNCQQRVALEQQLRQKRGITDSNQIMEIPVPGVPPNYLGVSVTEGSGNGNGDGGGDDDTANGDEWAKNLVVDREDKGGQSE